jgi:hypothetical protein
MIATPETMVHDVTQEFQALIDYVTNDESRHRTAYEVERTLFRRLLALGAALLRLFFISRAAARPSEPRTTPSGRRMRYTGMRETTYVSVFGTVRFARHYYTAPGHPGTCPLDAELSLPKRCYSDLLREWFTYGATEVSYRATQDLLTHILGQTLSVQALETSMHETAVDAVDFFAQPPDPAPVDPTATILVAQADGKGIPLCQSLHDQQPARLQRGQKRSKKKEAIVTSLYTIAPHPRTPEAVVAALLHEKPPTGAAPAARPAPVGKELRATLAGKAVALERLAQRVRQHDHAHIQQRVALTDGAEALQQQMQAHLPQHTLVLDIIHATEYLWDAVNGWLGDAHPERQDWMRHGLTHLLRGETQTVISWLELVASDEAVTTAQRTALLRAAGYYRRNQAYMRYDQYLAQGWPIGTGVVEGACRHVVKDRMEQSGMRWTKAGAQAVLDLRAIRINGQWETYWAYHRQQQHERRYAGKGSVAPQWELTLDSDLFNWAA